MSEGPVQTGAVVRSGEDVLSGVRRGPLVAGERVTLRDPKGRRHSVLLTEGGAFHTTKGGIASTT